MRRLLAHTAVIVAAGSLVAGCSTGGHMVKPESISDKTWVLTSINGAAPVDSTRVTMEFKPVSPEQGRVSGQGPCNRYFGGYKVENKMFGFTPMGSTMMACPAPLMQEERDYLAGLEKVSKMTFKNNMLTLKDEKDSLNLTYGLETGLVRGRVESTSGGFPADSQMIIRLQDQNNMDSRPAIIGMETIKLKEAVLGPVAFSVKYAPQLVQQGHSYAVNVQVMNKGKVIYASTARNTVNLHKQPAKTKAGSVKG